MSKNDEVAEQDELLRGIGGGTKWGQDENEEGSNAEGADGDAGGKQCRSHLTCMTNRLAPPMAPGSEGRSRRLRRVFTRHLHAKDTLYNTDATGSHLYSWKDIYYDARPEI